MLRLSSAALRVAIASALLLGIVALPGAAIADPMRVALRVVSGEDDELLSRVEGQTVDLDVTLDVVRVQRLESTLTAQIEASEALARERDARVVVWFGHTPDGGVIVHVAEPGAATALIREMDPPPTAAAEGAALVVRSALRALAAGGRIGVETTSLIEAPPPPDDPDIAAPAAPEQSGRTRWWAGVGWHAVADGESPFGQQGLAVQAGAARGAWRASIAAGASLPAILEDDLTIVDLARHSAGVALGYDVVRGDRLHLELGVDAGVIGHFRSTVAVSPDVHATPSTVTAAAYAGPHIHLRWQITPRRAGAWLQVGAGADVVFGAPELGYELDGVFVPRNELWPVQPRFHVVFVLETR